MRRFYFALLVGAGLFMDKPYALAINASGEPLDLSQPDGTRITLRQLGDEFFHWFEDLNGYTVVRVDNSYHYATLNGAKQLEATDLLVGQGDPSTLQVAPHTIPPRQTLPRNENFAEHLTCRGRGPTSRRRPAAPKPIRPKPAAR